MGKIYKVIRKDNVLCSFNVLASSEREAVEKVIRYNGGKEADWLVR